MDSWRSELVRCARPLKSQPCLPFKSQGSAVCTSHNQVFTTLRLASLLLTKPDCYIMTIDPPASALPSWAEAPVAVLPLLLHLYWSLAVASVIVTLLPVPLPQAFK